MLFFLFQGHAELRANGKYSLDAQNRRAVTQDGAFNGGDDDGNAVTNGRGAVGGDAQDLNGQPKKKNMNNRRKKKKGATNNQ